MSAVPVEDQITVVMEIPLAMIGVVGTGCGLEADLNSPMLDGDLHAPHLLGDLDDDDFDGGLHAASPAGAIRTPGLDGEVGCTSDES